MNFGEQLGTSIGGFLGSRTQAKGYDKAKDYWRNEYGDNIETVGDRIDPNYRYRREYGKEARGIMTGDIDYQTTADFQFAQEQGQQGINRSNAAQGLLMSGSAMTDASKFNMGLAYQNLNTYLDRLGNLGS